MFRRRYELNEQRRAIILLVVLALLTLFSIVGISFVLYANSEATASKNAREGETQVQPDMDAELLLAYFLGQLIYDLDDFTGTASAMRGHSLARTMFGYNYKMIRNPNPPRQPNTPPPRAYVANETAYNGTGRFHTIPPATAQPQPGDYNNPFNLDDYNLINYQYYSTDGFLRDPERLRAYRKTGNNYLPIRFRTSPNDLNEWVGDYTGGFNPPYTYPDLNNMFLAAVKADGTVLTQSFFRPVRFDQPPAAADDLQPGFGWLHQSNPNWGRPGDIRPHRKYMLLRPRPIDMGPGFPYPEDPGGDVKNLINSPGCLYIDPTAPPTNNVKIANNDSIWMDLGAPVMIAADGTKFKPLFAPLIMDLDNRLNLNVHGNIRGRLVSPHASNQGWGPWEVNLGYALDAGGPEWPSLFTGIQQPQEVGRYGPDGLPTSTYPGGNMAASGTTPHFYAPVDYDGQIEAPWTGVPQYDSNGPSDQITLLPIPRYYKVGNDFFLSAFPFKTDTNFNLVPYFGYGNGNPNERIAHPMLYNFFNPQTQNPNNNFDAVIPLSNMEAMLRYGETNSPGFTSSLFRLERSNFSDPVNGTRRRGLLTTHSFALDRAGVTPWYTGDTRQSQTPDLHDTLAIRQLDAANNPVNAGPPIAFPPLSLRGGPANVPPMMPGSEFKYAPVSNDTATDNEWRAVSAGLQRVDLNRNLTPYPIKATNPYVRFDSTPLLLQQYVRATNDRQNFARDIYYALISATGAYDPVTAGVSGPFSQPTVEQIRALRWLAQLAVNIVDFIDEDDIMTPFPWTSYGSPVFRQFMQTQISTVDPFVFGTEIPRVVINEAYIESNRVENTMHQFQHHDVDVWVELFNMFRPDTPDADPVQGNAALQMPPGGLGGGYPVYQVGIAKADPAQRWRDPNNVRGDPPTPAGDTTGPYHTGTAGQCIVQDFTGDPNRTTFIKPTDGRLKGAFNIPQGTRQVGGNEGFYVIGPFDPAHGGAPKPFPTDGSLNPGPDYFREPTLSRPQMSYRVMVDAQNPTLPAYNPTIVLRRLACPYLPPNPAPGAAYNPYITVDYAEHVYVNNSSQMGGTAVTNRQSYGKTQPYWAKSYTRSSKNMGTPPHQPHHTFFYQNADQAQPPFNPLQQFVWLPHLDRKVNSPMELLEVSGFKPHELTQQFMVGTGDPEGNVVRHRAPWFDQTTRLYRVFELLETYNRAAGVAPGGRVPGRVNINTVWDMETFLGLCDAQPSNYFYFADLGGTQPDPNRYVKRAFNQMVAVRSRGPQGIPTPNDRPFLGMGAGFATSSNTDPLHRTPRGAYQAPGTVNTYQIGQGINDTLLRAADPNADVTADGSGGKAKVRLFQAFNNPTDTIAGDTLAFNRHPYSRYQMLTKLFNNVTTRSNVFAVWVTVGFFKVTDDTTTPVKLGAEIGKAENRHIRHRMFAIVDRSNLTVDQTSSPTKPGGPPIFLTAKVYGTDAAQPVVCGIDGAVFDAGNGGKLKGSYEGYPWPSPVAPGELRVGTHLMVNYGKSLDPNDQTTEREYVVQSVNPGSPLPAPDGTPPTITFGEVINGVPTGNPTLNGAFLTRHSSPVLLRFLNAKLGNPGPQARYNPRDYPWVVRYFSIIN